MEKTCRQCGTPMPEAAKYCPECGHRWEKLCANCGEPVEGMKFCMQCGTAVEPKPAADIPEVPAAEREIEAQTEPAAPAPAAAPVMPEGAWGSAVQPTGKKSRKGLFAAAAVLCVVLLVAAVYILRQPQEDAADPQQGTQQTQQQSGLPADPSAGTDDPQDVPDPPAQSAANGTGIPDVSVPGLVDHMTLEQVWQTLDGVWYTGEFTRDGMMYLWVRTENGEQILQTGILSSEQCRTGTVNGFKALGDNRYSVVVQFPAAEATPYAAAMEAGSMTVTLDLSAAQQDKLTVTGDIYAKENPAVYDYAAGNMEAALYLIYG